MHLYKISEGAVACLMTAPSGFREGLRLLSFNGTLRPRGAPLASVAVDSDRLLLYVLLPVPNAGEGLRLVRRNGAAIADMVMPDTDRLGDLDLPSLLEGVSAKADRLRLGRGLVEGLSGLLRTVPSDGLAALRDRLLDRVAGLASTANVLEAINLGQGLTLWRIDGGLAAGADATTLAGPGTAHTSPFKPMRLKRKDGAVETFLLTETPPADVEPSRLFLWGRDHVRLAEGAGCRRGGMSRLPALLQEIGEGAERLRRYLAAGLAPYAAVRSDLVGVLAETMVMRSPEPAKAALIEGSVGAGIHLSLVTDTGLLFVHGWVVDRLGLVEDLVWKHPSGADVPLSRRWHKTRSAGLPDYAKAAADGAFGFVASAQGSAAGRWTRQQVFELRLKSGSTVELLAPPAPLTAREARDAVLKSVSVEEFDGGAAETVFGPVVSALHAAHLGGDRVVRTVEIGTPPAQPDISVIVPLYRVLDFLRYQVAAFAADPDFARVELVLVLDSPEQAADLEGRMRALHGLYGVPARIVVHDRNFGYAPAINTGVARSRAPVVMLMNSDVVPTGNGWLSALRSALGPKVGAVGPKLLFHDGSVQHAGMDFARDLKGRYYNMHPFKGFPAGHASVSRAGPRTALTGACMMLQRSVFDEVGGVCEDYVVGDFEDSDFCLRIAATGRSLWYEPAAALYHYERQSISQNASHAATAAGGYNNWLHTRRWRAEMDRAVGRPSAERL